VKTGFGLLKRFRSVYGHYNLFRFWIRKKLLGFEVANLFIQKVDKISLKLILSRNGAIIGKNCDIETGLIFHNCKDYTNLTIGNDCHIGKNCFFDLKEKVIIGNNVVVSMQSTFITHLDMSKSNLSTKFKSAKEIIIVKDNSYVGANTTILKGVTLEESSFVAACSLVNRNVDSYTLFGGNPAKKIKNIN